MILIEIPGNFKFQGDTVASCDSYGTVKLWDVRAVAPMVSFDCGPHPANRVAFDPTGKCCTCGFISANEVFKFSSYSQFGMKKLNSVP